MEEELTKVTEKGARRGKKKKRILIYKKEKRRAKERESALSNAAVNISEFRPQNRSGFRKKGGTWRAWADGVPSGIVRSPLQSLRTKPPGNVFSRPPPASSFATGNHIT